jgi:hypothetical protein
LALDSLLPDIYTMVKKLPDGTVTVTPDFIAIGPAAIAFLPDDIV